MDERFLQSKHAGKAPAQEMHEVMAATITPQGAQDSPQMVLPVLEVHQARVSRCAGQQGLGVLADLAILLLPRYVDLVEDLGYSPAASRHIGLGSGSQGLTRRRVAVQRLFPSRSGQERQGIVRDLRLECRI